MRKVAITLLAVFVILLCVGSASAVDAASSQSFGFETGLQGWKLYASDHAAIERVDGAHPVYSGEYSVHGEAHHPWCGSGMRLDAPSGYSSYTIETWIYVKGRNDAFASSMIGFATPSGAIG